MSAPAVLDSSSPDFVSGLDPKNFATFFEQRFALRIPGRKLAVAVSGGPDSLALALLLDVWARKYKSKLVTLSVDHQLRSESARECAKVHEWMDQYNIEHHTLIADIQQNSGNLMAIARQARYTLLADWCRQNDISCLATGHHLDDQIETFLMRARRESGIFGLSAMAEVSTQNGLTLLRPLLGYRKVNLEHYLNHLKQPWINDPTNEALHYDRTHIRQSPVLLNSAAETAHSHLQQLIRTTGHTRAFLEQQVNAVLEKACHPSPFGFVELNLDVVREMNTSRSILLRSLQQIIRHISGADYAPGFDEMTRLTDKVHSGKHLDGTTLGGCYLFSKKDRLFVLREEQAAPSLTFEKGAQQLKWDKRFDFRFAEPVPLETKVECLGKDGWQQIKPALDDTLLPDVDRRIFFTLPAFVHLDEIVAVPHLNYVKTADEYGFFNNLSVILSSEQPLAGPIFQPMS